MSSIRRSLFRARFWLGYAELADNAVRPKEYGLAYYPFLESAIDSDKGLLQALPERLAPL
jgi:hypothetical protein